MTEMEQLRAEIAELRREVDALKKAAPIPMSGKISLDGRQVGLTIGNYLARPGDITA